ncbi:EAL domain-containing protein [Aquincola sp. S2]|uniref:EAL domain-containing protein n=1 Tax=Pseudaquabacterium terrae TaxID=2732868 RepID=A0ABX2ELY6_9BURK|nr:EAL domain-containing protein [Aquabacterium terrae]NRF69608.1 EAL domain-containing protein [Aquabacterium terrae]
MGTFDLQWAQRRGVEAALTGWPPLAASADAVAPDTDDALVFAAEDELALRAPLAPPWSILVVDDDPEVHEATTIALDGEIVDGRPLAFLHAYSAREARALLASTPDIAVVLLDVVMENEYAGLQLARAIREDLGLAEVRIVLRTGQPGYAPELQVIREYDVNDYKTKSELTRTRLVTTITTAVRSYEQLRRIRASQAGLQHIVHAAAELATKREPVDFAEGVLQQAAALLRVAPHGLVCAAVDGGADEALESMRVVWADGPYRPLRGRTAEALEPALRVPLRRCLAERRHHHADGRLVLHVAAGRAQAMLLIDLPQAPDDALWPLLAVFGVHLAAGFANVQLFSRLNHLAYTDRLCGLPNRQRLIEHIDNLQSQRPTIDAPAQALLLIDLQQFSQINDALGPRAGDLLLLAVAARLRERAADGLLLARVAADVFALLGPEQRIDAAAVTAVFDTPFQVERYPLPVRATLGQVRLADVDGDGLDALKCANIALNRAKTQGDAHCHYSRRMAGDLRRRLRLLNDLQAALDQAAPVQLQLHYQPKVALPHGRIVGAEALLRWRTAAGDEVPPEQIVSLAESAGLMVALGERVMHAACRAAAAWRAGGHPDFGIAVNVSPSQFRSPGFVESVQRCLAATGLAAAGLELEITETIAMQDIDAVIGVLHALRRLGVRIALDDFGTGFSSLAYLHQLPIHTLKIDRSFLRDFPAPRGRTTMAELVVRLGRRLKLDLVAEGIETAAQAQALERMGCRGGQGYLFSPPLAEGAFAALLAARR